jgi:hypothetical protein
VPRLKLVIAAAALTGSVAFAPPALAASHTPTIAGHHHHACTRTSSGTCIQGGEFCRQDEYGQSGWDAQGRRYVCKGSHVHPHWEIP